MPSNDRYSRTAIGLHWLIALFIIANFAVGLRMEDLEGAAKFAAFQWHKSLGFTVLALSVLRLLWRFTHRPPPLPQGMKGWERLAAAGTHWALYALIIAIPLTGWIVVSASPYNIPTVLYDAIPVPHIGAVHDLPMPQRKDIAEEIGEFHELLAFAMAALVILHIAAALKHQFVSKDNLLARMMP